MTHTKHCVSNKDKEDSHRCPCSHCSSGIEAHYQGSKSTYVSYHCPRLRGSAKHYEYKSRGTAQRTNQAKLQLNISSPHSPNPSFMMRSRLTHLLFLIIVILDCSPSRPRPRPQSPPLSPQPRRSRSRRRRRFSDRFACGHGHDSHTDDDYSYPLEHTQSHGQRHSANDPSREDDAPRARPARKTVRWGPVTKIPSPDYRSESCEREREHSPRGYPPSCILAARPCLKPPTPLDQEMVLRNLRAMVDESANRLDMYYNAVEYFSGDVVLDEVMCQDERYLFQRARRQSLRDTFGVRSPSHSPSRPSSRNSP